MNLNGTELKRLARKQFYYDLYPSYSPGGTQMMVLRDCLRSDIGSDTY
jgi:hypothetical protein